MPKNNKSIILGTIIVIIIAAIIIVQNPFKKTKSATGELQNNENTGLDIGNLAPDFILNSIGNKQVQLSSFRGKKAVIVNFWATWCAPCREEMPAFEEIFIKNKDRLIILGVNLQESNEAIGNFLEEIPVTYTLLLDPNKKVKELYNIFTQPVTYFINKDGIIADKKFGPLTEKEIEEKLDRLLQSEKSSVQLDESIVKKLKANPELEDKIRTLSDGTPYLLDPSKILSGGPPKDGIPSIDNPKFQPAEEADAWLEDDDLILGLEYKGVVRAYPHRILNWHEIVNDKINNERVLITYCPLCRTGIAFRPTVNGKEVEFGTSGKLYNSELVMYDRLTDSYWPQTLGIAVVGPAVGQILEKIPLDTVRWEDWKKAHPDTEVLRKQAGFARDYDRNPYSGIQNSDVVGFGVEFKDARLKPKQIVYGVEFDGNAKAYEENDVKNAKLINDTVNGIPIAVVWDNNLNTVKIFKRTLNGKTLNFELKNNKTIDNNGIEWAIEKMKNELKIVDTFGHFWFAWAAFFPQTELYNA